VKVVGLDLSLTSTGVAVATENGAVTDRITSQPARKVGKGDPPLTLAERADRLDKLVPQITDYCSYADLVVIEGPSYGSTTPSHDRSGLWWLVVDFLTPYTLVVEVPPSSRMKYATGKGQIDKDLVLSAVIRRYPHVDVNGNDEADALILAAMGARHLGHPLETPLYANLDALPATHRAAMDAVTWPNPDRAA
jgi:crossover junction endodeoxyribonuclease RuvC